MTRSIDLFHLQETDSATDSAERRLAEIAVEIDDPGDLPLLETEVLQLEADLAEVQRLQREADDALEDQRSKTRTLEEKLYGGTVKASKELKNLQDDLQSHQKHLQTLENNSLSALERREQAQAAIDRASAERDARVQERQRLKADLVHEREETASRLERLRADRDRHAARIDPPDLTLYERLRRARGGRAVAKVERGTCQGCRITLPTTVFQRARSGLKIVQCTSCERILYVV
ncbi:MAG: zinc ribbon domain-containing protein [Dehalococcoidia bacterium]